MTGRPPAPRSGKPLSSQPSGFPLFYTKRQPRIVTADPWAFLAHVATKALPREQESAALAYIDQAFDFFQAAENPRLGSRSLLYYYSFLNLAKAALLIRKVKLPPHATHGISDPKTNRQVRLHLEGQRISVPGPAADHSTVFPEFLLMLESVSATNKSWRIPDLLRQIPSIHRTLNRVTDSKPTFLPVQRFVVMSDSTQIWIRIILNRHGQDVKQVRPALGKRRHFAKTFALVQADNPDELWYETKTITARGKGIDQGIAKLAPSVRSVGVSSILTATGFRYYMSSVPPSAFMPRLGATYAVAFYLGSITRYKPQDFDKIVAGKYRWVVEEFLATEPTQFLYSLSGWLAGVDVVRPLAITN